MAVNQTADMSLPRPMMTEDSAVNVVSPNHNELKVTQKYKYNVPPLMLHDIVR